MKSIKKGIIFLVNSNVLVALSAGALTKISLLKFGSESNDVPIFIVMATLLAYNYIRLNEFREDRLQWYRHWFENNRIPFVITNIIAVVVLIILWIVIPISWKALLVLIPFSIITIFYVKPTLFSIGNWSAIRGVPFVKILSIALSWAGVTVLFPIMQEFEAFRSLHWIAFFECFLFIIALTIPFDIRDVHSDSKKMQTIPQIIGVNWSKWMAIFFLILILILEHYYFSYWHFQTNKTIVLFALLSVLIAKTTSKRPRLYTSFWIESVPILWLLLILYF